MTSEEREQQRINTLLLLKRIVERNNVDYITRAPRPIYDDIERDVQRKRESLYFTLRLALIYVFAFGEVYGVRRERARRKSKRKGRVI